MWDVGEMWVGVGCGEYEVYVMYVGVCGGDVRLDVGGYVDGKCLGYRM